ncbi:hypothetical protein D3C87_624410 [compost metagenome]
MKKDRETLETHLKEIIDSIKTKRKVVEKINNELYQYNLPVGTFSSLARGDRSLASIDVALLCLVTLVVHNETNDNIISPYEYFTEGEIETSKKYVDTNENDIKLPLTLSDVTMLDRENFVTKIKMTTLAAMTQSQLIVYDFETQRSAKYKKNKDGVVPVPDVNKKSVEDISMHMLNQTYLADMITLNVYSTVVEPLYYDQKQKTLTINEGATISILDGFHRLQAGVRATAINPSLELEMILSIRSYDTDTAKKYFGQINTINIVKPERIRELNSDKKSDLVVKDLQMKSDLKGKIASASHISEIAGQLTTFDILSYGINEIYSPQTTLEAKEVSDHLIDFFNYLVGSFVDEFLLNPNEYRKTNINHPLVFLGYLQISKHFLDTDIKLKEIKDYVSNIDFQADNLVELLNDKRGINNKRVRNKIIEYFKLRGERDVK